MQNNSYDVRRLDSCLGLLGVGDIAYLPELLSVAVGVRYYHYGKCPFGRSSVEEFAEYLTTRGYEVGVTPLSLRRDRGSRDIDRMYAKRVK